MEGGPFIDSCLHEKSSSEEKALSKKKGSVKSKSRVAKPGASEGRLMRFDMPSCGGCRTCEMACSFHHLGEFVPTASSFIIEDKENATGCDVVFVDVTDGQRLACDGCRDLDVPLCVDYCKESDDLWKILQEFLEKRGKANEDPST